MTILGTHEDDDHRPESGTLFVRDEGAHEKRGPFRQHGSKVQPCGTIVRTGNGWLEGAAGPGPDVVRLELHDSAPEDDTADWADVVEIQVAAQHDHAVRVAARPVRYQVLRLPAQLEQVCRRTV